MVVDKMLLFGLHPLKQCGHSFYAVFIIIVKIEILRSTRIVPGIMSVCHYDVSVGYILFRAPFAPPSTKPMLTMNMIYTCVMHNTTNGP